MKSEAEQKGSARLEDVKGIIFLLDDVLYDRQDWLLPALSFAGAKVGLDPDNVALLVDEYSRNNHCLDSGVFNFILTSSGQCDSRMNLMAFGDWVNRYRPAQGSLYMYPGVRDALKSLRFTHELAVLAEGNVGCQRAKLSALDCTLMFRHICYTDEIDGRKSRLPDDRALLSLLKRMDCEPRQVMFIGSHPRRHFSTPDRLGLLTVRSMTGEHGSKDNDPESVAALYNITSAARIPSMVGVGQGTHKGPSIKELTASFLLQSTKAQA